jgi:LSU ribosomal protein L2P
MTLKTFKTLTQKSTRGTVLVDRAGLWKRQNLLKSLVISKNASKGRNNNGHNQLQGIEQVAIKKCTDK